MAQLHFSLTINETRKRRRFWFIQRLQLIPLFLGLRLQGSSTPSRQGGLPRRTRDVSIGRRLATSSVRARCPQSTSPAADVTKEQHPSNGEAGHLATADLQPPTCNRRFATADLQPPICNRRFATAVLQPPICNLGQLATIDNLQRQIFFKQLINFKKITNYYDTYRDFCYESISYIRIQHIRLLYIPMQYIT